MLGDGLKVKMKMHSHRLIGPTTNVEVVQGSLAE